MICLGVDPTDPRSKGPCTYSVGDVRRRELIALGTLERGRECDELVEVIERHHVEAVAVEVAREIYLHERRRGGAKLTEIVRALLAQNLLAGELLRAAKVHTHERVLMFCRANPDAARRGDQGSFSSVTAIDAPTWRSIIGVRLQHDPITREPSETYDAAVHRAIRMLVRNWLATSTNHERDATGVWLGAFLTPRAKYLTATQPVG